MTPLVKVGGLADVGGALPRALREIGLDVRVALPLYRSIDGDRAVKRDDLVGGAALWTMDVHGVPVYLIEHEPSFGREAVYGYDDDVGRFLAFSDALLSASGEMDWEPDIIHLNDWHPGAIATRLAANAKHPWSRCALVCTVHNVAFTGEFDDAFARRHSLDVEGEQVARNMLAQAVLHADAITAASPTYARELVASDAADGLAALLAPRSERLRGISNGLDVEAFDPSTDKHLAATFAVDSIERRLDNKTALQAKLGFPEDADVPLIGMVSRLFWQKGIDLAVDAIEALLQTRSLQFVALGQGDDENERTLVGLAERHSDRVAVNIGFDEPLGQLIYGGSDIFLMPSRYEPGGIGQLIAMRYGAVPVVHRTGGLADSVSQCEAFRDAGTGFLFDDPTPESVAGALEQAIALYEDRDAWRALQRRGMSQDFSWRTAAESYREVYEEAITRRNSISLAGGT